MMNTISTLTLVNLLDWISTLSTEQMENRLIEKALTILHARMRKTEDVLFTKSSAVKDYMSLHLMDKQQEVFVCLFLDNKHRLIESKDLFYGTINSCSVYPREVVKQALLLNAAALLLAHNHPSGVAEPSESDRRITQRLQEALALVDIRLLDHFIIGEQDVLSFAERGLLNR